jgi:hypothetical protein
MDKKGVLTASYVFRDLDRMILCSSAGNRLPPIATAKPFR